MRSPSSPTSWFCANCDATPSAPTTSPSFQTTLTAADTNAQSSSSATSSSHDSRSSTPLTEISSALSSPTFALPMDTEEIQRRRQQSDTASAEIGKRMLKGWALLATECLNPSCYGIPLVRPPKTGSEKDPRQECVVCGTVYVDEKGARGQGHLVSVSPSNTSRPQYDQPMTPQSLVSAPQAIGNGKDAAKHDTTSNVTLQAPNAANLAAFSTSSAIEASVQSLELTLHALSDRLKFLSSGPILEPSLVAQTADAISRVSQALREVKQLQSSGNQAHAL
ncbi:hypothetical protein AcW1_004253 [Taiwanofungus camphoratus]|nr:hypothetical protein AcW1_004253 [Antrodia cinnamomea]